MKLSSGRRSRRNLIRAYVQRIFSRLRKKSMYRSCSVCLCVCRRTKERLQQESNFLRVASSRLESTVLDRSKQLDCYPVCLLSGKEGQQRERGSLRLPRSLGRIFPQISNDRIERLRPIYPHRLDRGRRLYILSFGQRDRDDGGC